MYHRDNPSLHAMASPKGTALSDVLYFAAKAPRLGFAKTRLGKTIGDGAALALYRAFITDLSSRFSTAPFQVGWYVTPADAWPDLVPLLHPSADAERVVVQPNGDWAWRQAALFRGAADRGEGRTMLAASDSPQLTVEVVESAFSLLSKCDVVLGPVHDGGYYLIGMRGWHDILSGVAMSTANAFEQIVKRSRRAGLSVGLVEATFDIDEEIDLVELHRVAHERDDLPATRAVLQKLALGTVASTRAPLAK